MTAAACKPARAMVALIALATELPMPKRILFYDVGEIGAEACVSLDLATIADGLAWAKHLNAEVEPYVSTRGERHLGHHSINLWHGWRLLLNAWEPTDEPDRLTADETTALTALAEVA